MNSKYMSKSFQMVLYYFFFLMFTYYVCAGSLLLVDFFCSCSKRGLFSSCGARASYCSGFSCCRAQALGHVGFSSCGSQAPEHRLRSCSAWAQLHVGSSRTRGGSHVSCTGTRIPLSSATRETQGCYFSFSPHCRPVHKSLAWSQLGSFLTCPEGSRLQVPCMHMEEEPSLPVWSGTASTGSDLS